jgi:hypothetical protein
MSSLFLGIDPGVHGGLAVVEITNGAAPILVECIDTPVIGTGAKERVDSAAIFDGSSAARTLGCPRPPRRRTHRRRSCPQHIRIYNICLNT